MPSPPGPPDLLFFQELWENPKPSADLSSPHRWDSRADGWVQKLEEKPDYRQKEMARVQATADFLRGQGLLEAGHQVLDIGCGPGLFSSEFARTAGFVTGLDLSPRMARHADAYAKAQGRLNTHFMALDFKEVDLQTLGGASAFDLVVSSLTPAISGLDDLYKMMALSRGFCLHVSFVQTKDSLREQIIQDLYGPVDQKGGHWDGRIFYSLVNLLFLGGYYPLTSYFTQDRSEELEVDEDLVDRYTRMLARELRGVTVSQEAIQDYLESRSQKEGPLKRQASESYGFILWDVRKKRDLPLFLKELL